MTLEETVGKTIADFCGCGFTGADINHCAHFVSHVRKLQFGMTCLKLTGEGKEGANVRVQEVFPQCPKVGWLDYWSRSGEVLVFVTDKENVDLKNKTMRNVPKKHIGIYDGSHIYHYGNTQDKVVKQTIAQFKTYFQGAYGGDLGFYFGTIPGSDLVPLTTGKKAVGVTYEIREKEVYARIDGGAEFFVARRVTYGQRAGLAQISKLTGPVYDPDGEMAEAYGQWAYLVYTIGVSESSNRFNRLNSYDRAAFTFGFFQLAAHTPKDNLVLLLRRATELEEFQNYFPELQMKNGRLHRIVGANATDLEVETYDPNSGEMQLRNLMTYLNPSDKELDDAEIIHAAKLVALCEESSEFCNLQVRTSIQITAGKFRNRYQKWYDLSGALDTICTAIADIHHQGRGKKSEVQAALDSNKPLAALTKIGEAKYPERCESLRKTIAALEKAGKLSKHKYEPAHGLFVPV